MRAAEAAIANPLLDDVCMKGARGLLISITGGSDLTLYEVDEAATRIREEVDQDANVIFGATRDNSLEGIVRVSVVATGIDQECRPRRRPCDRAPHRRGDRAPAQRGAPAPARRWPITATPPRPVSRPRSRRRRPRRSRPTAALVPAPVYQPAASDHAPLAVHQDVNIRQAPPKPVYAEPMLERAPQPEPMMPPASFIPPRAEDVVRAPRMPRADELPIPGQRILEQSGRGQPAAAPAQPEKKRVTLMERLAAAGFGRKHEDDQAPAPQPRPVQQGYAQQAPAPQQGYAPPAPPVQHALPAAGPAPAPVHQEYAKRQPPAPAHRQPAQGTLDQHGRQPAPQRPYEDDHLEIPAFLRRQSN